MRRLPSLGSRGEGWVIAQGVVLTAVVGSGILGPAWSGTPRAATGLLGVGALAAGAALVAGGARALGRSLTPLPHPRDDSRLVESGPYRWVRHPIYGGLVLATAGWALLTASPATLALWPATAAFFWRKARREEAWLEERFPGYDDYRRRTRRLLPGLS
jgi:protein-S-isoprenylcysteine O-methyltransferase Ste14